MPEPPQVAIRDRLVLAKGHVEGIIKMVDDGKDDTQVLRQILAVHAQLEKASVMVLEGMLESFMDAPKVRRKEILTQIRESLRDLT
ncbi:MAG TPA: metal-sensing transcriptional repressor [Thermoplasmata archaeon]|nr:metal-sensing transcriptional repressor [Thermoplasmata archaeon]